MKLREIGFRFDDGVTLVDADYDTQTRFVQFYDPSSGEMVSVPLTALKALLSRIESEQGAA